MMHATYMSSEEAGLGLPQLGVRFPEKSMSWIANGTSNLRTVRQMVREY